MHFSVRRRAGVGDDDGHDAQTGQTERRGQNAKLSLEADKDQRAAAFQRVRQARRLADLRELPGVVGPVVAEQRAHIDGDGDLVAALDLLEERDAGLPALELLAGVGLCFELRGSLTIMAILLLIFLVVLGYAVWNQLDIDCGCFTTDELAAQDGVITAFRRDLIMIGATLFLYWRRRSRAPQNLWIGKIKTLKLFVWVILLLLKWYRYSGHLEKCVIGMKLLEVTNDNEEKELFESI